MGLSYQIAIKPKMDLFCQSDTVTSELTFLRKNVIFTIFGKLLIFD